MGWGKRILGIGEAAAGTLITALTPAKAAGVSMIAKGGADIAGSFGGKKAGQVYPSTQRTVGPGPQPPASSIEQSRGQNKQRMKSIYNYP